MEFNTIYHVFNHANGRENLFSGNQSYNLFLEKFEEYISPVAEVYAYCLMPNHFHFLLRIRSEKEVADALANWQVLKAEKRAKQKRPKPKPNKNVMSPKAFVSKSFSNCFNAYSRIYNLVFTRYGSMFIKNFKRKPVEDHSYFATVLFYIHHNPVKDRFADSMENWYWSSYNAYYKNKKSFVSKAYAIKFFGDRKQLIEHHQLLAKARRREEDPLDYLPKGYGFQQFF